MTGDSSAVNGGSAIQDLKAKVKSLTVGNGHASPSATWAHPLDPLSASELSEAVEIIRKHALSVYPTAGVWFKFVTLLEPPKVELVPYLNASRTSSPAPLARRASALIAQKLDASTLYTEYTVNITDKTVLSTRSTDAVDHAPLDADEMLAAEEALLSDPDFCAVVDKLRLPEGSTVCADPWPYGSDTTDEMPRLIPFMLYYRRSSNADSNQYAFPLPLFPILDPHTMKLHSVQYTPIYGGESIETIESLWDKGETFPWEAHQANEYLHELQAQESRQDLKTLEVVQKNGPSFKIEGQKIFWQKWELRVGFNYREGLVVHDVRYDGRDVFHRLSISDMTVPYGDPRAPFHRKQAFDLGDVGAGVCANQLDLGCDCLGSIHYFSADTINSKGQVKTMKNVVCVHEQDEGIAWKHTNYRTGKASVTRSRVLVLQIVLTVANYEYVFAWKFDQAAAVHLEARATGILSTHAIMPGETSPYGTVVNPGVLAPFHQHLFSIRIDPAIGRLGEGNTVMQEDSVPMEYDPLDPPKNNPYGVGYTVKKEAIEQSGYADAAPEKNRIFKVINPTQINPISGRPIGYKLVPVPSQLMISHPKSVGYARAEFANHHIWVTRHKDDELYAGGNYTNQSTGSANGIKSWAARNDTVKDSDLVLWHTFGLTHNPRVEDFPVMPCEIHTMSLKPVDFFTTSPAMDIPASTQAFNNSVLVSAQHMQGSADVEEHAKVNEGANGGSCC